jgi:hypothetical protein
MARCALVDAAQREEFKVGGSRRFGRSSCGARSCPECGWRAAFRFALDNAKPVAECMEHIDVAFGRIVDGAGPRRLQALLFTVPVGDDPVDGEIARAAAVVLDAALTFYKSESPLFGLDRRRRRGHNRDRVRPDTLGLIGLHLGDGCAPHAHGLVYGEVLSLAVFRRTWDACIRKAWLAAMQGDLPRAAGIPREALVAIAPDPNTLVFADLSELDRSDEGTALVWNEVKYLKKPMVESVVSEDDQDRAVIAELVFQGIYRTRKWGAIRGWKTLDPWIRGPVSTAGGVAGTEMPEVGPDEPDFDVEPRTRIGALPGTNAQPVRRPLAPFRNIALLLVEDVPDRPDPPEGTASWYPEKDASHRLAGSVQAPIDAVWVRGPPTGAAAWAATIRCDPAGSMEQGIMDRGETCNASR